MSDFRIENRAIGDGHPTYVIAELSANHNQSLQRALEIVGMAADAGADAVKLQTYSPDSMTLDSLAEEFVVGPGTLWTGRSLYDLYAEAHMPWDWHKPLQDAARAAGVHLFSTPFDPVAVEFLSDLDMPAYKVASFEIIDNELVRAVAKTQKPVILSTGMATEAEIGEAVSIATEEGAPVALLRCNSAYPSRPEDMDLRTIPDMISRWWTVIGLSDHTLGSSAAVIAVSLGARIIEKHVTMARAEGGPDSGFSLEPEEFRRFVADVREAEAALGDVRYGPSEAERPSLAFRRSLFIVRDIAKGQPLTRDDVRSIRPAGGLAPRELGTVLGRRVVRDLQRGTPLSWDDLFD